jgi:hypothetical protein
MKAVRGPPYIQQTATHRCRPPAAGVAQPAVAASGRCRSTRRLMRCRSSSEGGGSSQDGVGVVIVDHGSRKAESNDMLLEFAELYR